MSAHPQITFLACLPRSRSAWCANLLTHGPSFAYHEPLRWALRAGVPDWLALAAAAGSEYVTFCDTAFGLYWKDALERVPAARVFILWQGPEVSRQKWNKAVAHSGQPSLHDPDGAGLYKLERELRALDEYCTDKHRLLDMRVRALDRLNGVLALWEFCTGDPGPAAPKLDRRRARMLMDLNVQPILNRYIEDSAAKPSTRMIDASEFCLTLKNEKQLRKGTPCH